MVWLIGKFLLCCVPVILFMIPVFALWVSMTQTERDSEHRRLNQWKRRYGRP